MPSQKIKLQLGINIDHVATLRQARGGDQPHLIQAAKEAIRGGADSITVHLREDRRHIQDCDLPALKEIGRVPLNLEMALVPEIIAIALKLCPKKVCMVPERRREVTTEGGLDVVSSRDRLKGGIAQLQTQGIEVSLFVDPQMGQIRASSDLRADAVEIHTGAYSNASGKQKAKELSKIKAAAKLAHRLGLHVHAGHGLDYENVKAIVRIPEIRELNIGHSIISRALFVGLYQSVAEMKKLLHR